MLVSLSNMLKEATRNHYAVGAFNIGNKDIMEAIIQAAEDEQCPAIIECAVPELRYLGKDFIPYVRKRLEASPIRDSCRRWFPVRYSCRQHLPPSLQRHGFQRLFQSRDP